MHLYCNKNLSAKSVGKQLGLSERSVLKYLKSKNLTRAIGKNYKYTCNENFFSEINTEEKAYWLGVIFADGNVSLNSCGTGQLFISSIDEDWLKRFLNTINSTSPLYKEIHKKYQKCIWKVHITNNTIYDDLHKVGVVPKKSLILRFPKLDETLIPHFIRGYFDGDGCVTVCKYLPNKNNLTLRSGISSGSKEFLEKLLSYLPVKCKTITTRKNGNLSEFKLSVNDSIAFAKYIYKDATIYLQRKYDKFNEYIKQRRSTTIIDNLNEVKA